MPFPDAVQDAPPPDDSELAGLVRLAFLSVLGGAVTGVLGGAFRLVLIESWRLWEQFLLWARDLGGWRLLPCGGSGSSSGPGPAGLCGGPRNPRAVVSAGGGHDASRVGAAAWRVVPAKFVGGSLALGVGMALGREGPTVQMGASVGAEIGRRSGLHPNDTRSLSAALAGAGLAWPSAPDRGAVFVFEELARAIRTRLVVATLISAAVALAVARPIVGSDPVFPVSPIPDSPLWHLLIYAPMGLFIGWLGIHYNRLVILMLDLMERMTGLLPEIRAPHRGVGQGRSG